MLTRVFHWNLLSLLMLQKQNNQYKSKFQMFRYEDYRVIEIKKEMKTLKLNKNFYLLRIIGLLNFFTKIFCIISSSKLFNCMQPTIFVYALEVKDLMNIMYE